MFYILCLNVLEIIYSQMMIIKTVFPFEPTTYELLFYSLFLDKHVWFPWKSFSNTSNM